MSNTDKRIAELKNLLSYLYLQGDKEAALKVSQQLDTLIVKAQRIASLKKTNKEEELDLDSAVNAI